MNCPNCGTELKDGTRFCIECGAPLADASAVLDAPVATEPEQLASQEPEQPVPELPVTEEQPFEPEQPKAEEPAAEPQQSEPEAPQQPVPPVLPPVENPPAFKEQAPIAPPAGTDTRSLLTTAQYFFLMILFQVPIVGLVFQFIWGLGRPRNLSLKRFALATLVLNLAVTLLSLLCVIYLLLCMMGVIPSVHFRFSWIR